MKRIVIALLAVAMLLLAACAPAQPTVQPTEVTTTEVTTIDITTTQATTTEVITTTQTHEFAWPILFVPNQAANGWDEIELIIRGYPSEATLISGLVYHSALPQGSILRSPDLREDILHVDMNQAFAQGVNQMGTTGEWLMLGSLVNTLLAFHDNAQWVQITVDGQPLETGHNVYYEPLGFSASASPSQTRPQTR
ncbi:MAG: GerMN domain-containing protein [Oscillospiraceae bacterium]|nr:GerMN domain-containing protein [Oscillospiraceae bacterium]